MAEQRGTIEFTVDGLSIAALTAGQAGRPGARPRRSYAPTPVRELIQAPHWPEEHLPGLAPRITVPVHNALAEFDALWDSTPANVEHFAKLLTAAPFVDASIARSTGHSIDHHILGHALHLRQLAFAEECQLWASQPG